MSHTETPQTKIASAHSHRWVWVWLLLIMLLAAFFRLYRLDAIPPGLTHDEADTGYFVQAVYNGARSPVKAPYGYANELFTMYSGALFMRIFGPNDLALRLHSAFFGLLMLLFGYLWARQAFDAPTALGATALGALSFWPLATARFALNPQPAPALFAGAVWFLWLAFFDKRPPKKRWWAWLSFALLLAAALWAYEVARSTSVALGALWLYFMLFHHQQFRKDRRGLWFAATLTLGLILAAPHLLDTQAWQRSDTLAITLRALQQGEPGPLLKTTREALGSLTFKGEPFLPYSVPGRPIFDWPIGLLFYGGLLFCLKNWRRPACAFTLLWTLTGLLPSMIVGVWNSTLHSMGMQPVVFVPPALFAVESARWLGGRYGKRALYLAAALFVGLIALTGWHTYRDYFLRWGQWPAVRAAYFHNLTAISDYLNQSPHSGAVSLSSPFPDLPHDPFIADLRVQRDDLRLHWFDGRMGLLLPKSDIGLLIVPTSAPLHPRFQTWLSDWPTKRIVVNPDDLEPHFDVVHWQPNETWRTISAELDVQATQPPTLPVNLGALELVGYHLETPNVAPGGAVSLLTAWRVLDPQSLGPDDPERYGRAAALFVHLLGPDGRPVAQDDRLNVPAWGWQAGDRFVQIHQFSLDPVLPPGSYPLQVGAYTKPDMARLSVQINGQPAGDHILLTVVEVRSP